MKALLRLLVPLMKVVLMLVAVLAAVVLVGLWLVGSEERATPAAPSGLDGARVAVWTCSMHPQIRADLPGNCPICGMPLVPAVSGDAAGAAGVVIPEAGRHVAQIETAKVGRGPAALELPALARFIIEEQRFASLTAWIGGRVERVHVPTIGAVVAAGAPLVDLYAPELLAATAEMRAAADQPALLAALRERFHRYGFTDAQTDALIADPTPSPRFTLHAPIGGVVLDRSVEVGNFVAEGDRLFRLASLDPIVVELDVYERDLALVGPGTKFTLTVDALPGRSFEGAVEYWKPLLDEPTRTLRARATLPNPGGLARPGMFARATLHVALGADGRPLDLTGPAVPAAAAAQLPQSPLLPLLLPASALLDLGSRKLVYVERPGDRYEPVVITVGPRVGDAWVVLAGLDEGDAVVVRGAFLVDSQTQFEGKPSLLFERGAGGGATPAGHAGHGIPQAPPAQPAEHEGHR